MASSPVPGPAGVREGRAQSKSHGRFHHSSSGCALLLAPAVKEILQSCSIHRFLVGSLTRPCRLASSTCCGGAGGGLDVAARAARLGVRGKDEAVGEGDRAGGLAGAGRLGGGLSEGSPNG